MNRNAALIAVLLVLGAVGFTQGQLQEADRSATKLVYVGNFPVVQNVAGSVDVGNLPAVQTVSGSVEVANLPTDETGAIRVASASGDCSTETLVTQLADHLYMSTNEDLTIDQAVDLLDFYGGTVSVQVVIHEAPNTNTTFVTDPLWYVDVDQQVGAEDRDGLGSRIELKASSPIKPRSMCRVHPPF